MTRAARFARLPTSALSASLLAFLASIAGAEVPSLARWELFDQSSIVAVGTCEKVERTVVRRGSFEESQWTHHLRIERIERDTAGRLAGRTAVAVRSWSTRWLGDGSPPPHASGHRGLPAEGESRRVFATLGATPAAADPVVLDALVPNGWQPAERRIVLVGADDEYRSEASMPLIARCLERDARVETMLAYPADPATGKLDLERRDHIAGLEALREADAAVFFLRWRELDDECWTRVREFLSSGQPVVGLRTSTHMIRNQLDAAGKPLDNELPTRVFGQRWISHHGHTTRTKVLPPEGAAAGHPILRGVRGGFEVPSWLYDVEPLPADCVVLLHGEVVGDGSDRPVRQPIVWIREAGPVTPTPLPSGGKPARRMAFTTLGHPGDFQSVEVRRLVEQMVLWAAGDESAIPADGLSAALDEPYVPLPTR